MEKHREMLLKLCRLCGQKIALDEHYTSVKLALDYKEIIKLGYNIDLNEDHPEIHPTYLCHKCYMKVYYISRQSTDEASASRECITFTAHVDDERCTLCSSGGKRGRPKKKLCSPHSVSTSLKEVNSIALRHGFKLLSESPANFFLVEVNNDMQSVTTKYITLSSDGQWGVQVCGWNVRHTEALKYLPDQLNSKSADLIFSTIAAAKVCEANPDFPKLIEAKLEGICNFQSPLKEDVGLIETIDGKKLYDFKVIRHNKCQILITNENVRCGVCTVYRDTLRAMESRKRKSEGGETSMQKNDRYLTFAEKEEKLRRLEKEKKALVAKNISFMEKVRKLVKGEGMKLDEETDNILRETINEKASSCPFSPESPQFLLWEQQKLQCSLKDNRAMRWHPLIIRWCLSIYLKSPSTYKHIRSSPFMFLPCKDTLLKYVNFTDPGCGFNEDILLRMLNTIDLPNLKKFERNVTLSFDEMKIKSGLVFCSSTGKLVGFTEMGSINNMAAEFERRVSKEESSDKKSTENEINQPLAKYVIVFMVRGIFTSLCYPFGHFASTGFTSDQLYFCAWEAVRILELMNLKVRAITADGASPNRKFFKLHKLNVVNVEDNVVFWTWNEWCLERKIFFICDVPHLIKTLRNNLENSHGNNKTRNLMFSNQTLGWHQILNLYEWDLGLSRDALGLRMGHKLREEHINLNPRSRMRVNLAAQVLSSSVARALEEQGVQGTKSLRKFIVLVDRFFDCLNVSKIVNKTRKDALNVYRSPNDPRFEWLQKTFLQFFNNWEEEVHNVPNVSLEDQNRMCISKQTLEGLRITVHSFVTLGKLLLSEEEDVYLLSERFTQDPLEEYFSKQRQRGGCNDNPTLQEFNRNFLGLNVAGDDLIRIMTGNTRGRYREEAKLDVKNTTLPPAKKSKKP